MKGLKPLGEKLETVSPLPCCSHQLHYKAIAQTPVVRVTVSCALSSKSPQHNPPLVVSAFTCASWDPCFKVLLLPLIFEHFRPWG